MEHLVAIAQSWLAQVTWLDAIEAFFVLMSIVGQHYISEQNERGFVFWIVGNVAALVMFATLGRWMTCALYLYFLVMCLRGLVNWRRLRRDGDRQGLAPAGS